MTGPRRAALVLALTAPAVLRAQVNSAPILLPPFLVEETKPDGIDWVFGKAADLQVLSGCGTDQTAGFIEQIRSQRGDLLAFIPGRFLVRESLPLTVILYPKSRKAGLDEAMRRELDPDGSSPPGRFRPMDDLRLSDADSSDIFVVFDDRVAMTDVWLRGGGRTHSVNYPTPVRSPAYLRFLLEARVPALPRWYVSGVVGLYETMDFAGESGDGASVRGARFTQDPWLSKAEASALEHHPETPRPLMPLSELLCARYPADKPEAYRRVWEAQAELFVRWCLSGRIEKGAQKLELLVEGASSRPTTEEFFRQCFGMDYDDALEALSDYLPHAVGHPVFVASDRAPGQPSLDLRTAAAGEVRRIKAEWSRRVLAAMKADHPAEYPAFLRRARESLERSYSTGDRDPAFLSTLALFRIQNGDAKAGIALLESDPAAASSRPLAQLEVAEDHLTRDLQHPGAAGGKLTDAQAAGVMRELSAAVKRGPIQQAYDLAARVYIHLGREPSRPERAALDGGVRLFAGDSDLALQAASLDLRAGDFLSAKDVIELGMWEAADPVARRNLGRLRQLSGELTVARSASAARPQD
ncbi:MAG TPA: hypothetical protein VGG34_11055 [Opitutaceae bacterium]|jgi:hypothetical protein